MSTREDGERVTWIEAQGEAGLVSVVVPCFNRERWVGATLDSLRAQTWRRLEVIVVDDGSTDASAAVVRESAPLGEGRELRLCGQANAGVSAARNRGTRESRGEFLVYLDSDDVLHPRAVERYVAELHRTGAPYVIAPIDATDEQGRLDPDHRRFYPKEGQREPWFDRFWLVHGACYRRGVVAAAGPWDETLRANEDHEFEWRVKAVAGEGPGLREVVGAYRQHSAGQLHREVSEERYFPAVLASLERYHAWLERGGRLDRTMRLRLARQYRFVGTRLAMRRQGEPRDRAYAAAAELCAGLWHPLRWARWLGVLDAPRLLGWVSRARWRRALRRRGAAGRPHVEAAGEEGGRVLVVSPVTPREEGIGPERRVHALIAALACEHQVSLLVVPGRLYRQQLRPAPDYLGGRWWWVEPTPGQWTARVERGLAKRLPRVWAALQGRPSDWLDLDEARLERARVAVGGRSFHVVLGFRLASAPYAEALRGRVAEGARWWLDLDELDSVTMGRIAALHAARGEPERAAQARAETAGYARAEQAWLPRFERIFVSNAADAARLVAAGRAAGVLPNPAPGLDDGTAPGAGAGGESGAVGGGADTEGAGTNGAPRALFIGSLAYPPNHDAVEWWLDELGARAAGWRLVVAGRGVSVGLRRRLEAAGPGVEWRGEVERSAEVFAGVQALVAPLRAGGGTRVKILEAWARGVPVVSTEIGIEGLGAEPGRDHLRAETAAEFADALERLRTQPELRVQLAAAGRSRVEAAHGLEARRAVLASAWAEDVARSGSAGREER